MDMYKFNLITYSLPPFEKTCSLLELQQLCEERLQLYKIMDEANKLDYKANSVAWENYVKSEIIHRKLKNYIILFKNEEYTTGLTAARRNNHIAHWLTSLCYSGTTLLRTFFMRCELYWFVILYKTMKREDILEFINQIGINYSYVDKIEKDFLKERLLQCRLIKESNFDNTIYFKTKFSDINNLVRLRKVFLYKGFAYFPETDLIFCMKNLMWKQFNKQLLWTCKMLPTRLEEVRLEDFLRNIPLVSPSYRRFSDKTININLENIDDMVKVHFPLCMKTIHSVLREKHHLKYDCKMQYGIFLKWVGLSYENAIALWKSEFTQNMSSDWFDRKYSYLFRHQYGKVGGKIDYKPYSCKKILNSCPNTGQHHGCPFKHWDLQKLLDRCENDGFTTAELNELKHIFTNNEPEKACTLYFNVTHKVNFLDTIKSPNEYFEASYEFEDSLNNCLNNIFEDC